MQKGCCQGHRSSKLLPPPSSISISIFRRGGAVKKKETSKNPRLNKVLAGEAYTYPKLARYRETHSSLKFHLKILQYSYYCFGFMCC